MHETQIDLPVPSAKKTTAFGRAPASRIGGFRWLVSLCLRAVRMPLSMSLRRTATSGRTARRQVLTALWLIAAAGQLPAAKPVKPPGQEIRVELKKPGDTAEVGKSKEGTLVTVHSANGIGGATLIRPEGGWPRRVTVRLDLKGMESLRIESGTLWTETSLDGERRRPYWKKTQTRPTEATAVGRLEFTVTKYAGGVEVEIPRELLDTRAPAIKLEWVDFFR